MIKKKTSLSKTNLYQLLFALCLGIPCLNIYLLTFFFWAFVIFFTLQKRYSLTIFHHIFAYLVILVVAFFSSLGHKTQLYFYIKDICYLLKPILGFLLGYQLLKYTNTKATTPYKTIVYAGVAIATIHIFLVFITFARGLGNSVAGLRQYSGYFNDFEIYVLVFLIFSDRFYTGLSKKKIRLFIAIMALSTFFYLARTNFIEFIILIIAIKGYFKINTRSVTVILSTVCFTLIGYTIIYNLNPRRDGSGVEQFLFKIKNAPIEPFKTKIDIHNWKDLNDNYRSYENVLTIKQVSEAGKTAIVVGKGLGSSIDLKQKIWLQSSYMRYIPFLHNSYMTAFLKAGLVGVLMMLYYIFVLMSSRKSNDPQIQNINLLLVGTGVFLIISNWVFLGLYNTLDGKSLLIGFLIAYREFLKRSGANT